MKIRKPLIIMLALMMICIASINVFAAEPSGQRTISDNIITPCWTNTESIHLDLGFSGTRADCSAMVIGKTGTSRITATVKLQRKNTNGTYTNVKTWAGLSANGSTLTFNDSYNVTCGYTYRLMINATVYKGGSGENVSKSVEKYCS